MIKRLIKGFSRFQRDERGVALILVSLALPAIFGMAAFAIDLGYAVYVKTRLQTAADLGALAGGTLLYKANKASVEAKALEYVNLNLPAGWDFTPEIEAECNPALEAQGLTCDGASQKNALRVSISATSPLFFASALGFTRANSSATALVSGANAAPPPLNVAIVIDSTGSMNDTYTGSCGSLNRPTKIQCALAATRGMLGTLWPSVNQVALYTYPGVSSSTVSREYCSPSGTVTVVNYKSASNPTYRIVDFSTNYRGAGTPPPPGLNTASNLVKAVGGNGGCVGLQARGGAGTFYADAVSQAQAALVAANATLVTNGQQPRQNVLMILSDGDAQASSSNMDSAKVANQCLQGITAAQAAAAAGTWVYSVAYQANNSVGGSCQTDTTTTTTQAAYVTVTTRTSVTTTTQSYNSSRRRCDSAQTSQPTTTTVVTTQAPPAPANSTTTTRNPTNPPTCSSSNRNVSYTTTTVTVSSVTTPAQTSTSYDRTACKTMELMASDPSKFFSVAGASGCISPTNPNTTDLVSIFKNVAVSLMKMRRIPASTR